MLSYSSAFMLCSPLSAARIQEEAGLMSLSRNFRNFQGVVA
ncbi:hypothetical protein ABIC35_001963 [Sphingomonas trueperi]